MADSTGRPMDPGSLTDDVLEAALRDLSGAFAMPGSIDRVAGATAAVATGAAVADPARLARLRIEQARSGRSGASWRRTWLLEIPRRRIWRGLVLALIAVLVVAALAGAIRLGLPGIEIVPAPSSTAPGGGPSATPVAASSAGGALASASPTPSGPLGAGLGLGEPVAVADAATAAGFPILTPTASGIGSPLAAWLLDGRLSLVWPASPTLPATGEPGIGLLISEFRGSVDPGYFRKVIGPDTAVETVSIGGVTGYWISGAPHEIVYVGTDGEPVFESRRSVGDTLLWTRGDVTYRLETGLGRAGAIALAESLR